jgi:hypothetical protein
MNTPTHDLSPIGAEAPETEAYLQQIIDDLMKPLPPILGTPTQSGMLGTIDNIPASILEFKKGK